MPANPLVVRVLDNCLRELGSIKLAKRLGVTPTVVDMWRNGQLQIPEHEFILLIDVLLSLTASPKRSDKA